MFFIIVCEIEKATVEGAIIKRLCIGRTTFFGIGFITYLPKNYANLLIVHTMIFHVFAFFVEGSADRCQFVLSKCVFTVCSIALCSLR